MQIRIHLDSARLFRWHLVLLDELKAKGHSISVSFVDTPEPLPASLTALFDYDRARSGQGDERHSTRLAREALSGWPNAATNDPQLTIDLATSSRTLPHTGRVLRPLYDGVDKDYALYHALLARRAPELMVADTIDRERGWEIGLPAIEQPWRIATAFDQVTSRLVEGLGRLVYRHSCGENPKILLPPAVRLTSRSNILASVSAYASARAARKVARLAEKLSGDDARWHVAWRTARKEGAKPIGETLHLADYRILTGAARSDYADPFLLVRGSKRHVFVEEVPAATGRGRIAHFEILSDGTAGTPQPVLEAAHHLSYPFVFEHEAQIYMLPEASQSGGLDLYRATAFPNRWEKAVRLIDVPLHDATLFAHDGKFWIAAATTAAQSSSWDALSLYYSDSLTGPWHPHALNPVLVDARAARPAGSLWRGDDGCLVRPAQDCSQTYGGALTLRRLITLTPEKFLEQTIGRLSFAPGTPIAGPHTLTRGGGIELIDIFAKPSALRAGFRAPGTL